MINNKGAYKSDLNQFISRINNILVFELIILEEGKQLYILL